MDIEKLIEQLRTESLYADKASLEIMDLCMDAATALSTLQGENAQLRDKLENYRKGHCSEGGCAAEKDRDAVLAELEQVKLECDAAQSLLAEQIGVRGAEPITTAFGLPLDRLRELAQADREGRCVVLETDRKKLESAFNIAVKYGFCQDCRWIFEDKNCLERGCYQDGVKIIKEALFGGESALRREQG